MDTGADKNLISYSLIAKLSRNSDVKEHDGVLFQEVHGETFPRTHSIELDFSTGLSDQHFSETFYISSTQRSHLTKLMPPEMQVLPMTREFPVILLGGPFLKHSHALVTDADFENPENPEYEVLVDPPPAGRESCHMSPSRALVKNLAPARSVRR